MTNNNTDRAPTSANDKQRTSGTETARRGSRTEETIVPPNYTPEELLLNLAAWNKAHRRLKFQRLVLDKRAADLRVR